MARPQKSGIDYFPFDVALDSKFELIEAEFGLTGFAVVVKLFQYIYGGQGYYCEWTNEVALLFSRKQGFSDGGNVVSEIVSAAIKRDMFSKDLYDKYHVLTSKGIQKRYFETVSRRKEIEVDDNILLVNVTQICPNVNILQVNVNINSENVDRSTQSKGKESIVKESIGVGAAAPRTQFIKPSLEEVKAYCHERHNDINPQRFIDFFDAANWIDSRGKKVLSWKQKIITWEKYGVTDGPTSDKPIKDVLANALGKVPVYKPQGDTNA
ncbi:MAG: DUF4373 domain-containing protein [Oscillospiraceae bacterium]